MTHWIKTPNSLTVTIDGEPHTLLSDSPQFQPAIDAIKSGDFAALPGIVAKSKATINAYGDGKLAVRGGKLQLHTDDGWRDLPEALADRILAHEAEGLPVAPLCRFATRLLNNPSARSVAQLFGFLEANMHPITDEGCFVAYKRVRHDYLDKHSGTFDNSPGAICRMPRNAVDEDSDVTCSNGLHVAGWSYASNGPMGDGPIVECKVDPAHVVAVPRDYGNSKMRVCEYTVIQTVSEPSTTLDYSDEE